MYISIFIYIHTHSHPPTRTHIYLSVYIYKYACVWMCLSLSLSLYIYICMHHVKMQTDWPCVYSVPGPLDSGFRAQIATYRHIYLLHIFRHRCGSGLTALMNLMHMSISYETNAPIGGAASLSLSLSSYIYIYKYIYIYVYTLDLHISPSGDM